MLGRSFYTKIDEVSCCDDVSDEVLVYIHSRAALEAAEFVVRA